MREIEFEVRRFYTNQIVGYERINDNGHWEHIRPKCDEWLLGAITDGKEYSKFIRRQFTGLTDKNGVKIFEGDICEDESIVYSIEWNQQQTSFWLSPIKSKKENEYWAVLIIENKPLGNGYYSRKDLTIIGNIHDNPEHLE